MTFVFLALSVVVAPDKNKDSLIENDLSRLYSSPQSLRLFGINAFVWVQRTRTLFYFYLDLANNSDH
jgi:hypothetical protein